jgi:6,7-dimethyl-8-ribityllumazine synthase
MATDLKNLSVYDPAVVPDAKSFRFGIVVSEWNQGITNALLDGAFSSLMAHGTLKQNVTVTYVPGSFELPMGAQFLINHHQFDAVLCLGCVIQGETRHFDFICDAVANGIMEVGIKSGVPVIFGVLTANNLQQAEDRAGGKHGNKGTEAAITAIKMAALRAQGS